MLLTRFLLVALVAVNSVVCMANNTIDIYTQGEKIIPIVISEIVSTTPEEESFAKIISETIANDLKYSGSFNTKLVDSDISEACTKGNTRVVAEVGENGFDNLLVGAVSQQADGKMNVSVSLWNTFSINPIFSKKYTSSATSAKKLAHSIADNVSLYTIGRIGPFQSKVLFISEGVNKTQKQVAIMDYDGSNIKMLTPSGLVMTPVFDTKKGQIIYVSVENGVSKIKVFDVKSGSINDITNTFPMLSNKQLVSPSLSPDGSGFICTVLEDNSSDIYYIDIVKGTTKKITNGGINVSPSWSPDGKYIIFSSDADGKPNLYIISISNGDKQKISKGLGAYHEPSWSPDGTMIVFNKLLANVFNIGTMYPDGSNEKILSGHYMAENPSWSPTGREIIYSYKRKYSDKSALMILSASGREIRTIKTATGALDPYWILLE